MIFFYLLVFVMPLSSHPLWAKVTGDLTVVKYLGGACVLYAFLDLAWQQRIPNFLKTWQARWFLLLLLMVAISYQLNGNGAWQSSPLLSYLSFLLLFVATVSCLDTLQRVRRTLLVATGSSAFASLYVIREWQQNHGLYAEFRPGWISGDANYYSLSVILVLPIAFALIRTPRSLWERWLCIGCMSVSLIGLMLAASRGGFLGLVAATLFMVLRSPHRLRNLSLIAVVLVPLVFVIPASPLQRLLHPTGGDNKAADRRVDLWRVGLKMIRDNPGFGIGVGNYKTLMDQYEGPYSSLEAGVAHNSYIEITAELGFAGMLVFFGVLVSALRSIERTRKLFLENRNRAFADISLAIEAGFVAYVVSAFFLSAEYQKFFWLLVFLTISLSTTARSRKRSVRTARRPEPAVEAVA
jgi:O-antigen ligase